MVTLLPLLPFFVTGLTELVYYIHNIVYKLVSKSKKNNSKNQNNIYQEKFNLKNFFLKAQNNF